MDAESRDVTRQKLVISMLDEDDCLRENVVAWLLAVHPEDIKDSTGNTGAGQ